MKIKTKKKSFKNHNLLLAVSYPPTTASTGNYLTDSNRWDNNNYGSENGHKTNHYGTDKSKYY